MSEWMMFLWPLTAGMGIGLFFYGSLWLTVNYVVRNGGHPAVLAVSFGVRLAVALALFYRVAAGRLGYLLTAALGFIVMRPLALHLLPDSRLQEE